MKFILAFFLIALAGCASVQKRDTDQFVNVDVMACRPIKDNFTKRQLSELDEWTVETSSECAITYDDVRIRKDRIRTYHSMFSSFFWRNDKYADDPGAPLELKEINIEHCRVYLGGPNQEKPSPVDLNILCSDLDKKLR